MPSRSFIQLLRSILQRALIVFRRRPWTHYVLRLFSFLYQKLFRGRPRSNTQDHSLRPELRPTVPRAFVQTGGNGVTLASCTPLGIGSTSDEVEPRSTFADAPHTIELPGDRMSLYEDTNHSPQDCHHHQSHDDASVTSLDVHADPIDNLRTLGPRRDYLSSASSLHHLPSSPHRSNASPPPRSPSVMSRRSGGSNSSAGLYRWHEGATPRPRTPHCGNASSAFSSVISLVPHSVIARPDSRLVAPPRDDHLPGSPTLVTELGTFRLAEMTSHEMRRYQKNNFK